MRRLLLVLSLFASFATAQEQERPMRRQAAPERAEVQKRLEGVRERIREAAPERAELRERLEGLRERIREAVRQRREAGHGEGDRLQGPGRRPGQGRGRPGERQQAPPEGPQSRRGMAGEHGRARMLLRMHALRQHMRHMRQSGEQDAPQRGPGRKHGGVERRERGQDQGGGREARRHAIRV